MRVVISHEATNSRVLAVDVESPETYDFFCTKAGDVRLLNVKIINTNARTRSVISYIFYRYEVSRDGKLFTWKFSEQKAAEAVRSGKLKGEIAQSSPSDAHPDVNFTDPGSTILAFIKENGVYALFNEGGDPLTRTAPKMGQAGG
jgi:hypothetical protein